jgi:hypothetical protein
MKCKVCGCKTSWDNSVGTNEFIVCNHCVNTLGNQVNDLIKHGEKSDTLGHLITSGIIIEMGRAMADRKKSTSS